MKLCKPEKWRFVMSLTLAYYLRKPKQSTSLERFCSGEVLFAIYASYSLKRSL